MAVDPTPDQIRKTFGRDAQDFVALAVSLGWRVVFNSTGTSITLIPYDDADRRIHLSSRNKNQGGSLRKRTRQLVRFADPAALERMSEIERSDMPEEVKDALNVLHLNDQARKDGVMTAMEEAAPAPEPEAPHVVSERAALMRRGMGSGMAGGGQSYPSKTTLERTWSDGSIDYTCVCCGQASENRRAFGGSHWAAHVRKGEAEPIDETSRQELVRDPSYTEPSFKRGRSHRTLAHFLNQLDLANLGVDELAEMILEFLGRKGVHVAPAESEPLTPEQIIDRVRNLVDRGTYARQETEIKERDQQLDTLRTQHEGALADLATATAMAEAATARAEEVETNMHTFLELAQGVFPRKTDES